MTRRTPRSGTCRAWQVRLLAVVRLARRTPRSRLRRMLLSLELARSESGDSGAGKEGDVFSCTFLMFSSRCAWRVERLQRSWLWIGRVWGGGPQNVLLVQYACLSGVERATSYHRGELRGHNGRIQSPIYAPQSPCFSRLRLLESLESCLIACPHHHFRCTMPIIQNRHGVLRRAVIYCNPERFIAHSSNF